MPSSYQSLRMQVHNMQLEVRDKDHLRHLFKQIESVRHYFCKLHLYYTFLTSNDSCFRGAAYLLVSLDIAITRPLFDLIGTCLSIDDQVVLVILKIIALTCHQMSQHSIYFLICSLFLTLTL